MGIILPTTFVGLASIAVAITGNYVFIYGGPFGWNGLGFIGSPLSTVLASWFQPCALAAYCCAYKGYHRRAWGGWRRSELTLDRLRVFASIAGPIACNSFASNLANALISLVAAKLGAEAIAANAVVAGMWGMLWALFWGYGCATQVRVANYLGAGQPRHAKRVVLLGLACTVIVVAALAVVTSAFDEGVVGIYTNDAKLLATCRRVLPVFVAAFVIEAVEMVLSGVLTGMRCVALGLDGLKEVSGC
jgi:MATE family multidrug resistance protein